jgi:hypothetical protein
MEPLAMKTLWRYVQFWSVLLLAAATLGAVLAHLQRLIEQA